MKRFIRNATLGGLLGFGLLSAAGAQIVIGSLDDLTGPTSANGKDFAAAKSDAVKWINANGGINGKKLEMKSFDYSYKAPVAISTYKRWMSESPRLEVIYGYGTADTEALSPTVNGDKVVYFSHSFSANVTDPTGASKRVERGTPFNFFHGPTYSDGCRAQARYAAEDWKKKGQPGKGKFVYMGDNHPYPNSAKEACMAYAAQVGLEVLPPIQYGMAPADFKAQCLSLKESGAQYTYLANAANGTIALLKSCATVGVKTQYFTNIYAYSEPVMEAIGDAADGVIAPVHVAPWGSDVPGMKLIRAMGGETPKSTFYMAAACTMMYLKEALEWADKNGGVTGPNVQKAMYQKANWVPRGLEGVCAPATWTATDHRSVDEVPLLQGVMKGGKPGWRPIEVIKVGRDKEWLGR
ncbi:MAG: ABC transporter substrate-binding protein [Burkholderiaceae bacterium]|nr:ABC transporter substrate-binding protein [Burkholderiaceae bacterium]